MKKIIGIVCAFVLALYAEVGTILGTAVVADGNVTKVEVGYVPSMVRVYDITNGVRLEKYLDGNTSSTASNGTLTTGTRITTGTITPATGSKFNGFSISGTTPGAKYFYETAR
jgi:hypothetical protein